MESDRFKLLVMYYIGYSIKTLKIKKHIDTNREYNFYHPNMYSSCSDNRIECLLNQYYSNIIMVHTTHA